jgi:hypothetical protein
MRQWIPRKGVILALILMPLFAFASTSHEITIESVSTEKKSMLVNAEIGNLRFQLMCFLNLTGCHVPKPGKYLASQATAEGGIYQDCYNISLFERLADGKQGQLVGTFCLLGDKAESILIGPHR